MNGKNGYFGQFHPIAALAYFISLIVVTMFVTNPVLLAVSLLGGILFCAILHNRRAFLSDMAFYLPLFVLISLTNPLFSHNGVTPLFFLNGNPVTLEAILYGTDVAAMLVAVIVWCKCWNEIMTSDKILYLFGKVIPKLSLVLSMSLRFLPLFKKKWVEIKQAQTAMGYYAQKGFVNKLQSSARIFSALVTWALENAVDTGASMKARGYGLRGRSHFALFRFRRSDAVLLVTGLLLTVATIVGLACGELKFLFYPKISQFSWTVISVICCICFAFLSLIPFTLECTEALRWKYLRSKI